MTARSRFVSARSSDLMLKVIAILKEKGGATVSEMAQDLCMSEGYLRMLLPHMARHSRIHCAEPQMRSQRGRESAIWAAGKLPVPDDDNTDFAPQRVVISSTWQRGTAQRDQLVAALFGAAQQ